MRKLKKEVNMGARNCIAFYTSAGINHKEVLSNKPVLNRERTLRLGEFFLEEFLAPDKKNLLVNENTNLMDTSPPPDEEEMIIGSFPGVEILSSWRLLDWDYEDYQPESGDTLYFHAMHSVTDWLKFTIWEDGKLIRSLEVSPDEGVLTDIGNKLPFELPYWQGQYPVEVNPSYPLPFHPLNLAEAALLSLFGYGIEGRPCNYAFDPETIPLMHFKASASAYT